MKKLLALVLALVMTLSLCVTSNAAYTDAADVDYNEAVDVMSAVGVFQGADGKFSPKANLTREQAAKLIAYLDLGESTAEALPAVKVFNDVAADRWSAKYIAYCADAGYINGVGDGNFDPAGELTGYAFGKMILCVLGYDASIEGFTGSAWSIKVAKVMEANNISKGVDAVASAALTREQAAQYCLNALKADMVEYSDKGMTITGKDITVTTAAAKAEVVTATSTGGADDNDAISAAQLNGRDIVQLGEKLYDGKLKLTGAYADDFGRPGKYWEYKTEKITASAETPVVTYTAKTKEAVVDKDLKNYTYPTGATVVSTNGYSASPATLSDADIAALTKNGTVVEVYANTNNQINSVVVINSYLAKVVKVSAKDEEITVALNTAAGTTITTDLGYGEYEVDDLLMVAPLYSSASAIQVSTGKKVLSVADVTEVEDVELTYRKDGKLTVGGVSYEAAGILANDSTAIASLVMGSKLDLVLDANGYVVKAVGTATVSQDYIYVYSTYSSTSKGETTYYALGVLKDGTVAELEIDSNSNKKIVAGAADDTNADSAAGSNGNATAAYLLYSYTTDDGVATLTYAVADPGYGHTDTFSAGDLKPSLKALNAKHYFADDVTFISVTGSSAAKLKATVYTGVQKVASATAATYVTTKSIDTSTNGTISLVFVNGSAAEASTDLVYVASNTAVGTKRIDGTNVSTYEVYVNGVKTEIPVGTQPTADKFYTYSVDENGKYTLDSYTDKVMSEEAVSNLYNGVLTTSSLTNYNVVNANIVDLTDNELATAAALENLFKTDATVMVAAVYDDDAKTVSTLYLTEASVAVTNPGTGAGTVALTVGTDLDDEDTVEVSYVRAGTKTELTPASISGTTVSFPGTTFAAGDVITVEITTVNGFIVTGTVTVS